MISDQSNLVEIDWIMPRGASRALGLAVNPCLANKAEVRPARAAPPG